MKYYSASKRVIAGMTAFGLLALFFMSPLPAFAESEQEVPYTEISDAAGLASIAAAPDGNYRLTEDIDLGGANWRPVAFTGKLDGNGHTLYNLHVTEVGEEKRLSRDGNAKKYNTEFAGLFSTIENAEISDLSIRGALVEISGRSHCFAGILTGYCDNSTVRRCSVEGRVHMISEGKNVGVAGLAGYGNGIFEECDADVELVFEDRLKKGKCEQFLGGIVSCGIGSFDHCKVKINGYISCHGYVHSGGIIGMFYHCGMNYSKKEIIYCYTEGQISFFEDNKDRRAYCKPIGGEMLSPARKFSDNSDSFQRNETKDYSKVLSPEQCEQPDYEDTITPPDCTSWGYTRHQCRGCGYSWIDSYTPPCHDEGEWVTISNSDFERTGLKQLCCRRCGQVLNEETIPVKARESSISAWSDNKLLLTAAAGAGILLIAGTAFLLLRRRKKTATASQGE